MTVSRLAATLAIASLALPPAFADEEELVPLFNGKDLSGWVNVNCAPGTFTVRDGMIVSTGIPTGVMRTERQYENFILELEWRHMRPKGNAGLFVWSDPVTARGVPFTRSIEVQILDGNHGDVFSIHGATLKPDRPHPRGWMRCLPSEQRSRPAGQWNHYRVVCRDGVLKLAVNGKVVSGASECKPRKGYICLESEGSECHFRNIRIRELPPGKATAAETADVDRGFESLYTGVDLSGWKAPADGPWRTNNWRLVCAGAGDAESGSDLWTERDYGDFVLICDWRWANPGRGSSAAERAEDAGADESGIFLRGSRRHRIRIGRGPVGSGSLDGKPAVKADERIGQWNRFVITVEGDRVSVELNGETVVEKERVAELPHRGSIGLAGDARIEFANLYVRETGK